MTLLTILGGWGEAVVVVEEEGDVSLRDFTPYAAALRDFAPYAVTLRDYTIYTVSVSDREST